VPTTRFFPAALAAAVLGFGLYFDHALSDTGPQQRATDVDRELAQSAASPQVRRIVAWAVMTQDHGGLPFVVIDPADARIYAFDPSGHPTGHALMVSTHVDDAFAAAGRLLADPIASARSGTLVWTSAEMQLTVGTGDEDAREPVAPTLRVAPAFWKGCLEQLRTQPSVAYVLPRDAERSPL
jgi:hypothetical protein